MKPHKISNSFKNFLTSDVELPNEIVLNLPLITIVGNNKILIENFKNIVQYSNEIIKINTTCGILKITGKNLFLKELNKNKVLINGILFHFEFI